MLHNNNETFRVSRPNPQLSKKIKSIKACLTFTRKHHDDLQDWENTWTDEAQLFEEKHHTTMVVVV